MLDQSSLRWAEKNKNSVGKDWAAPEWRRALCETGLDYCDVWMLGQWGRGQTLETLETLETFNSYLLAFNGYSNLTNMSAKNERGPPLVT